MRAAIKLTGLLLGLVLALPAWAGTIPEIKATTAERTALGLTVYNSGFAVIRDARRVNLPQGVSRLAFVDIAARINPATARLTGRGLGVIESNFDYDLLTFKALLQKHVGRSIGLVRTHPQTGEEKEETGKLLSVAGDRAIFRIGTRIEAVGPKSPYRFVFHDIPPNLREQPTLSLLVDAAQGGANDVELAYHTAGMKWSTDYVAVLSADETKMGLTGWITLVNQSGTAYQKAKLQLLAGQVNRVKQERVVRKTMALAAPRQQPLPAQEELFEYHLYTVPRPVDVANNQTKQIELLSADAIPVGKQYLVDSAFDGRRVRPGQAEQKLKVRVRIAFDNAKPSLGLPLPAGIMRLHKLDSSGALQFIGEDRIGHTPEGQTIRLELGQAFDVTATRKLTDYKRIYDREYETAWEINLANAKSTPVTVTVAERIRGQWEMKSESLPHQKASANMAVWQVEVPAKGQTSLKYRVVVK